MFKPAVRKSVKLKLALAGISGSGKTYSALLIAKGLCPNGRIAVIDAENDSASLYAGMKDIPPFDTLDLSPPFTSKRYMDAIKCAVDSGYDVLIIDQISHQWSGDGGILDRKDKEQKAKPTANSYTLWASYTPEHTAFIQSILQADIHVIATMRSKQDYILTENDKGKQVPKRAGMAPIQREGVEYEWSVMFELSDNHHASATKDRTSLFDGKNFIPGIETGAVLRQWLDSGAPVEKKTPPAAQAPAAPAIPAQTDVTEFMGFMKRCGWLPASLTSYLAAKYGGRTVSALTPTEYAELCETLRTKQFVMAMGAVQTAALAASEATQTPAAPAPAPQPEPAMAEADVPV